MDVVGVRWRWQRVPAPKLRGNAGLPVVAGISLHHDRLDPLRGARLVRHAKDRQAVRPTDDHGSKPAETAQLIEIVAR